MSKAILILEMPDRCGHCRLSAMVKYYAMCMVTGLECTENGRPEWCPLRRFDCLFSKKDLARATEEILGTNYGEAQCHESTMRIAEEALTIVYELMEDDNE